MVKYAVELACCKMQAWTRRLLCHSTRDFLGLLMLMLATCAALIGSVVLKRRKGLLGLKSEIPVEATQLNASVYELYSPSSTPSMEVLFFHGFQYGENYTDAHLSTWQCGDGTSIWPKTWLVKKCCDARILTVAYNVVVMKCHESQTFEMYNMGENLTSDLLEAKIGQDPCRPLVLVGHSFGGLVIKQLCVFVSSQIGSLNRNSWRSEMVYKLNSLLENIKGIFFYSTPHHGIAGQHRGTFRG